VSLPAGATDARPVSGGDINEAWHLRLADGRTAFVKTRAGAVPGEYAAEARGLCWLAEAHALRVPEVLEVDDRYLALAWIEPGSLSAAGEEELGRGLAAVHAAGAPHFGDPGVALPGAAGERASGQEPLPIGSLRLPNDPAERWPDFYVQRRLRPLVRMAAERHAVSAAGLQAVERVCARMGELAGPAETPARLHGDLWWGNVLGDAKGHPWLIDPAAYGGHREVDLAMLMLFGGQRRRVFDAYDEAHPLAAGFEERVQLWQLLPLLVHAVLFGGSYGAAVEQAARRYAG
jgi:fructosamine-3-kinase